MPDLPGLREQAESLLEKAEATPAGTWRISAEDHSTMVSLADAFDLQLPIASFRSPEGASKFLRLVLAAMRG
jgi:hypothetical protein